MKSVFVFNPESGKGKLNKYKDKIISNLSKKYGEIECIQTKQPGHAYEIAKNSAGKYKYFFVAGGDGTLNEVINGMGENKNNPTIGFIPCGTVNDMARSLGISRNIKKAVKQICEGEEFEHDIFKVNNRYGIYVCCAGLFTSSSYSTKRVYKKNLGKIAYYFKGAKEIFNAKPVDIEIAYDDKKIAKNCSLLLILNSRSVAGFRVNKNAELDDGKVDIVLFHSKPNKVSFSNMLSIARMFLFGIDKCKKSKKLTYLQLSKFNLNMKSNTIINLDGEKSGEGNFDFEVLPRAVKIIIPKQKK